MSMDATKIDQRSSEDSKEIFLKVRFQASPLHYHETGEQKLDSNAALLTE